MAAVSVRLDPADGALLARIQAAMDVALPVVTNTASGDPDGRHALWLGPDEWLVLGPAGDAPAIESAIRSAADSAFVVTVDVSANRVAFDLSGPAARELLESGCPIDLHPRAFRAGCCAQTLLARAGVLLHQVSDAPRYRVWIRPSFARYLAAWLDDAAMGVSRGSTTPPRTGR
jgi:sarcosine oxidase subunit gamma